MVAVGGWRGIGATTAALALAAAFAADDGDALFVEADPAGGVLAGRIAVPPDRVGGLEALAFPSMGAVVALDEVAVTLGSVRVVVTPSDPFRAGACHRPRNPWISIVAGHPNPAVVDVGRLHGGRLVHPVLERADHIIVVLSTEVAAAVSTVEWVRAGGRVAPTDPELATDSIRLLVVDQPTGVSFTRRAVESELGDLVVGWLPWDLGSVDLLHRGAPFDDRRLRRTEFVTEARRVIRALRNEAP